MNFPFTNNLLKAIFYLLIFLSIINLLVIDFGQFYKQGYNIMQSEKGISSSQNLSPTPIIQLIYKTLDSCPDSCLKQIYLATASVKTNQTTSPTQTPQKQLNYSPVKEFFIPLGVGSNSTDDWTDVVGAESYIDSNQYANLKKVTFEASVHIPTGNQKAFVRLFNETDKHPVWFSEVSLEGGAPSLLISDPITLDLGNKLYQVQMKTTLKYEAKLDQARIHIITY